MDKKAQLALIQKMAGTKESTMCKTCKSHLCACTAPKKTAAMRNIIDDIVKGAQDNTFGRPIAIQADVQDWTPLDTAKCAGMLQALAEQEYTLKEASEYLGLPEERLQQVIAAVR